MIGKQLIQYRIGNHQATHVLELNSAVFSETSEEQAEYSAFDNVAAIYDSIRKQVTKYYKTSLERVQRHTYISLERISPTTQIWKDFIQNKREKIFFIENQSGKIFL